MDEAGRAAARRSIQAALALRLADVDSSEGPVIIAAVGSQGDELVSGAHYHARGQLFGSLRGLLSVGVEDGVWIVPAIHAVWLPPHQVHSGRSHGPFHGWSLYVAEPANDQGLEYWADRTAISARTLSRRFVQETGFNFTAWRQRARLMRSLEMLAAGMSVTAIALDLGYATASAFIGVFRRTFGATPAAYRGQLAMPAGQG